MCRPAPKHLRQRRPIVVIASANHCLNVCSRIEGGVLVQHSAAVQRATPLGFLVRPINDFSRDGDYPWHEELLIPQLLPILPRANPSSLHGFFRQVIPYAALE